MFTEASLGHDDWVCWIFPVENSLFTRQMSFPLPASRQNHPPNSRGQGIFPTRAIYSPDNTLSNDHRPPRLWKLVWFLQYFDFIYFSKKIWGCGTPYPQWWRPCHQTPVGIATTASSRIRWPSQYWFFKFRIRRVFDKIFQISIL